MSEFVAYGELGLRHILDPAAVDHLLFLLVLAAAYRLSDWRNALWVVSAFTIGHSLTLALAVTNTRVVPDGAIEFLIPLTIVATGVENLTAVVRGRIGLGAVTRPILAGLFGLVHGAGFANYLRELLIDPIAVPLLGFNMGIEVAQLGFLAAAAVVLSGLDRLTSHGARVVAVSLAVLVLAVRMAAERSPWQP